MREVIDIRIRQQGLFWPLLLIILALMYWKWVVLIIGGIAATFLVIWGVKCLIEDTRTQQQLAAEQMARDQRRRQELADRADTENALWHAGDERGTYGLDFTDGKESGR